MDADVLVLVAAGVMPMRSVENNGDVWFELLLKFNGPAELLENRSNGTSIFGVAFLLTSFSGEVASDV